MEKIDLVKEVLNHSDDEIVAYIYEQVSEIKRVYNAVESTGEHPELLLVEADKVDLIYDVLKALNRRNAEKYV